METTGAADDRAELDRIHRLFPALHGIAFLNHAAASPIPEPVRQAMVEAVEGMATAHPPDARAAADRLRQRIATFINGDPRGVAITRSTAHGVSLLARGLRWRRGENVVVAEGDYPATIYPWRALQSEGVELRVAEGREIVARGPAAILDRTDTRTRVVCVNHVQFSSGVRLDVTPIGAECRRRGILLCVDVMQSLGAVAVDAEAMSADVVASGGHKWLLGPSSTAFCYLRPDLIPTLTPLIAGALSVVDPFEFTKYDQDWAPDAHRFEETWLSPPDLAGLGAAIELASAVGMQRIERSVLDRTRALSDSLAAAGMRLAAPWPRPVEQTAGIVSFAHSHLPAEEVLQALSMAGVVASRRGPFVRLSPHYHNPDREIELALETIAGL
ncbi:MAG: aminotransferase class V-fold PLP-dependent enzyme [Candidatus Dormibacteraceae bacterium]